MLSDENGVIVFSNNNDRVFKSLGNMTEDEKNKLKNSGKFLSNEIRSDSIEISAHKKICNNNERCTITKIENNLANEIKDKILLNARAIRIEESKKEKK